jgi:hypothetical protein
MGRRGRCPRSPRRGVAAGVSQRRVQGWCGGCAPNQSLLPRTPPGLGVREWVA